MIPKCITTGVHEPIVRVTNALLMMPVQQVPGRGHVTQHHIDAFIVVLGLMLYFFLARGILSFEIEVAVVFCFRNDGGVLRPSEDERAAQTSSIRVAKEVLDFLLDGGRQEVALDGADTFGRLCGDEVDAEDAARGFGEVDCDLYLSALRWEGRGVWVYLTPAPRREAQIYNRHAWLEKTVPVIDLQELKRRATLQTGYFCGFGEGVLRLAIDPFLAAVVPYTCQPGRWYALRRPAADTAS
jgi:hypothetical protein